jgi:hypothetical protein
LKKKIKNKTHKQIPNGKAFFFLQLCKAVLAYFSPSNRFKKTTQRKMDLSLVEDLKMAFTDLDNAMTKQRTAHLEQQNKQLLEILEKMNNEGKKISQLLDKIYSQVNEVIKKNSNLSAENQRLRNA